MKNNQNSKPDERKFNNIWYRYGMTKNPTRKLPTEIINLSLNSSTSNLK